MTVVKFDEPALHVDTDAAGEMCVVASDCNQVATYAETERIAAPRDAVVASQRYAAYVANPICLICGATIATTGDASYISARDRVVHTRPCLAKYVALSYGNARSQGSAELLPAGCAALEQAVAEADADLDRVIDRALAEEPPHVTLRCPSHLCGSQKELFKRRLLALIDLDPPLAIVIDMRDTRYVDASSLGMLISAKHALRREAPSGRMFLLGANEDIRALLSLTRLQTMFDLVATYQEVEDALNG